MTTKGRIKKLLRERFYDNVDAFVEFTGISKEELKDFLNGKSDFTAEQYRRIADEAKVSPAWLTSGEGKMDTASSGLRKSAGIDSELSVTEEPVKEKPAASPAKAKRGRKSCSTATDAQQGHYEYMDQLRKKRKGGVDFKIQLRLPVAYADPNVKDKYLIINHPHCGMMLFNGPVPSDSLPLVEAVFDEAMTLRWNMVAYAYRQKDLCERMYFRYLHAVRCGILPREASFRVIDFSNPERSARINLLAQGDPHNRFRPYEMAQRLVDSLQAMDPSCMQDEFFRLYKPCYVSVLAAAIEVFLTTKIQAYTADGGLPVTGCYADLPHVMAFLAQDWNRILPLLKYNKQPYSFMDIYDTCLGQKTDAERKEAMEPFLRRLRQLSTPAAFWILSGDDNDGLSKSFYSDSVPSYICFSSPPADSDEQASGCCPASVWTNLAFNELLSAKAEFTNKMYTPNVYGFYVEDTCACHVQKLDLYLGTGRASMSPLLLGIPSQRQFRERYGTTLADTVTSCCRTSFWAPGCDVDSARWYAKESLPQTNINLEMGHICGMERFTTGNWQVWDRREGFVPLDFTGSSCGIQPIPDNCVLGADERSRRQMLQQHYERIVGETDRFTSFFREKLNV